jgi:acetyl esterase/lipase
MQDSTRVNSYDSICRELALQTGFAVVFPEYTLAPEARYPTQQNQCYAVVKHIHSHGHAMGLSQSAFAIVGDSAGAQLSVATIIRCVTHTPRIAIKFQVLLSPVTDTVTSDRDTRSEFTFFNGPLLTVPFLRKSICAYIPNPADRISELASPRNISPRNARRQPPTLIVNSSADPLRDDGVLFGEILQRAGVDAVIVTGHGQLHDSAVLEATRGGATPRFVVRAVAEAVVDALSGEEKGVVDRKVGGGKRKKGVEEGERVVEQNKRRTSTRTRGM